MPAVSTPLPDVLSWHDKFYVKMRIFHSFQTGSLHSRFNVSLHNPATDDAQYVIYSEFTSWKFVRPGSPSGLLTAILDQLEEDWVPKGIVEAISVGPLSIFIELDEREADFSTLQELKAMIDNQATNLDYATVSRVQHPITR